MERMGCATHLRQGYGVPSIEDKAVRIAASEWSRGDASDIDGQNREVEMGGSTRVNVGSKRVSKDFCGTA